MMNIGLALLAGLLLLLYSIYFYHIMKGHPQGFELELIKALAEWMINRGPASRWQLWMLYLLSLALEIFYFCMVFYLLNNSVIKMFTIFLASFEALHLGMVGVNLSRFFGGSMPLKKLLNWPIERTSAILFFTHTLLVIINIIYLH
ncbi:MAG: hypothetical protein ABFD04_16745 [Syntrophomonas sp.]